MGQALSKLGSLSCFGESSQRVNRACAPEFIQAKLSRLFLDLSRRSSPVLSRASELCHSTLFLHRDFVPILLFDETSLPRMRMLKWIFLVFSLAVHGAETPRGGGIGVVLGVE